jgi:hypothetical protein
MYLAFGFSAWVSSCAKALPATHASKAVATSKWGERTLFLIIGLGSLKLLAVTLVALNQLQPSLAANLRRVGKGVNCTFLVFGVIEVNAQKL